MQMDLGNQIAVAGFISYALQVAKKSSWFPWVTMETAKINRIAMIIMAGFGQFGVHFYGSWATGDFGVHGLTKAVLLAASWHWIVQCFVTHGWYKGSAMSQEILTLLKQYIAAQPAQKQVQ